MKEVPASINPHIKLLFIKTKTILPKVSIRVACKKYQLTSMVNPIVTIPSIFNNTVDFSCQKVKKAKEGLVEQFHSDVISG